MYKHFNPFDDLAVASRYEDWYLAGTQILTSLSLARCAFPVYCTHDHRASLERALQVCLIIGQGEVLRWRTTPPIRSNNPEILRVAWREDDESHGVFRLSESNQEA
jgi:hypothetical protein